MGKRARTARGLSWPTFVVLILVHEPASAQLRIMPLGDSITAAGMFSDRYVFPLWAMLEDEGYAAEFVGSQSATRHGITLRHEGHNGALAGDILTQISLWASEAQPDIVLLHVGHNDHRFGQSAASTVVEIGQIIDSLRSVNPRVMVLVAQIIDAADGETNPDGAPHAAFINALNAAIPHLAAAKTTVTSPVLAVSFPGFDANVHTYDGIHPNEDGEAIMAAGWFAALAGSVGLVELPLHTRTAIVAATILSLLGVRTWRRGEG